MREFPIMNGPNIPWAMLVPHEEQALRNHRQSLETLASRGGLSMCEAIAVLEGRRWKRLDPSTSHSKPSPIALARLVELLDDWENGNQ